MQHKCAVLHYDTPRMQMHANNVFKRDENAVSRTVLFDIFFVSTLACAVEHFMFAYAN